MMKYTYMDIKNFSVKSGVRTRLPKISNFFISGPILMQFFSFSYKLWDKQLLFFDKFKILYRLGDISQKWVRNLQNTNFLTSGPILTQFSPFSWKIRLTQLLFLTIIRILRNFWNNSRQSWVRILQNTNFLTSGSIFMQSSLFGGKSWIKQLLFLQ